MEMCLCVIAQKNIVFSSESHFTSIVCDLQLLQSCATFLMKHLTTACIFIP